MAHPQQQFFVGAVKQLLPTYFANKSVLEIGSLNINGTVRDLFTGCRYTGIDVGEGRDVDRVCHGEDFDGAADSMDLVISCEAMEHNPQWRKTWLNMLRLCKPDGLMVMTCATEGRRQHGTEAFAPSGSPLTTAQGQNYYQNLLESDFTGLVNHDAWFSVWGFHRDLTMHDLYFFGIGAHASEPTRAQARELQAALAAHYWRVNIQGNY